MTSTTFDYGPVVNVNAQMQKHLDQGGKLELVVPREGPLMLDWLPSDEQIAELKAKLEGE